MNEKRLILYYLDPNTFTLQLLNNSFIFVFFQNEDEVEIELVKLHFLV